VEVNHAAAETAFVQHFELHADIVGEGPIALLPHDGREEQVDSSTNPASIAWAARSGPPTLIQAKLLRLELLKVKADLEWQWPECASWWDIEPGVPPQVAPAYDFLTHQGIVPAKWVLRESG
jgi:hypothetical protein